MKYRFLPLVLLLSSCSSWLLPEQEANTPLANYDLLCDDFRTHYGLFGVKGVNWDSLCAANRLLLSNTSTEEALYNAIKQLLRPLNDPHVFVMPARPHLRRFESSLFFDTVTVQHDFRREVAASYLTSLTEINGDVAYGQTRDSIGYLRLSLFDGSPKAFDTWLDQALTALAGTKGLILDIRNHGGGDDRVSQVVAGHFCTARALYMIVRKRNGPAADAFTGPQDWYVEPSQGVRYQHPVVLLTARFTQSAGETFTLAMRALPQVIHAGDTTAGGQSDMMARELPNGWVYTLSVGDYRAADGQSYEGRGIPPAVVVRATEAELNRGQDRAVEYALSALR